MYIIFCKNQNIKSQYIYIFFTKDIKYLDRVYIIDRVRVNYGSELHLSGSYMKYMELVPN